MQAACAALVTSEWRWRLPNEANLDRTKQRESPLRTRYVLTPDWPRLEKTRHPPLQKKERLPRTTNAHHCKHPAVQDLVPSGSNTKLLSFVGHTKLLSLVSCTKLLSLVRYTKLLSFVSWTKLLTLVSYTKLLSLVGYTKLLLVRYTKLISGSLWCTNSVKVFD